LFSTTELIHYDIFSVASLEGDRQARVINGVDGDGCGCMMMDQAAPKSKVETISLLTLYILIVARWLKS
jgi:hypothetical protein